MTLSKFVGQIGFYGHFNVSVVWMNKDGGINESKFNSVRDALSVFGDDEIDDGYCFGIFDGGNLMFWIKDPTYTCE